jgi:hypothetical protein
MKMSEMIHTVDSRKEVRMSTNGFLILLRLLLVGYAKAFEKNRLEYYIFNCKKHGRVVDYPHGYDNYLVCPKCSGENHLRVYEPEKSGRADADYGRGLI